MAEHLDDTVPRDRETLHAVFYAQLAHWRRHGIDEQGRFWWWHDGWMIRIQWPTVAAYSGVTQDLYGGVVRSGYNGRQLTPETIIHQFHLDGLPVHQPVDRRWAA